MRGTLYIKFIIVYIIFGLISFFTVATLSSQLTLNKVREDAEDKMYREANLIASEYAERYYDGDTSLDQIYIHLTAIDTYLNARIWIVNTDGTIELDSDDASSIYESGKNVIPEFDPVAGGTWTQGTYYDQFEEEMLSVTVPITSGFQKKGYVAIHMAMQDLTAYKDQLLNVTYITLVAIYIFSLMILAAFTIMVYRPLRGIMTATTEYANGNLKHEIQVTSEDEIGQLGASLNYMSAELAKIEDYQKKFIANVSHDFRSPLTSIKGYAEAILDGTIPPELYDKYLNIVLFETERLNKLTQSLLTLNDYDTKNMLLEKSDFDINDIIKKTAASFEGTCTAKKISIELILAAKTLYVHADVGKIQQVLYNLIDNAIKFTDNDSVICVETTEKNDKIFVSVKDSGIGIPRESLPKVWDRFYKTDLSRGKDKKGTGLGLSIVKEIIQAHNENIDVISTEGVGTEFVFSLPKAKGRRKD